MKKLLTMALALIVLAAVPSLSVAQKAAEKKPTVGEKHIDKPSPKLMTGKITQVNEQEKTFTIVAKGKEYKFTFQKIEFPYKVGEIIDVTYTENPGGPMEATNLNSSRSNID
jgi:hypothetical protein